MKSFISILYYIKDVQICIENIRDSREWASRTPSFFGSLISAKYYIFEPLNLHLLIL